MKALNDPGNVPLSSVSCVSIATQCLVTEEYSFRIMYFQEHAELHCHGHHVLHQPPVQDGDLVRPPVRAQPPLSDVHTTKSDV